MADTKPEDNMQSNPQRERVVWRGPKIEGEQNRKVIAPEVEMADTKQATPDECMRIGCGLPAAHLVHNRPSIGEYPIINYHDFVASRSGPDRTTSLDDPETWRGIEEVYKDSGTVPPDSGALNANMPLGTTAEKSVAYSSNAGRNGPDQTTQDERGIGEAIGYAVGQEEIAALRKQLHEATVASAGPDRGQEDAPDDEWEAVAGHELDDWGIRRKGEEDGMSVAQMLWERDAKYVVALHNRAKAAREGQAHKGDRIKVEREPGCKCEYAIWTNAKGCPLHGHGNLGVGEIV